MNFFSLLLFLCLFCLVGAVTSPAAPQASLMGTRWYLAEMEGQPITSRPSPWLELDEKNRLHGKGFCNDFSGAYRQLGETLRIGPLISTRKSCGEQDITEEQFFQILARTAVFRISEGKLMLSDGVHLLAVLTTGNNAESKQTETNHVQ